MDNKIFKGFYEKLPVKSRKGRGGVYPYVSADDVTDRMNKLFRGNWSSMVIFQDVISDEIIIRVRVEVNDYNGVIYSHEGFGGHRIISTDEPGNGFKSAYSKALVNACRRWGVGLFLVDDETEVSTEATKSIPTATTTSEFITSPSKPIVPPVVSETTIITQEAPASVMPKIPTPGTSIESKPTSEVKAPSVPSMPSVPPEIASSVKKTISSIPKVPTQATSIISQTVETQTVTEPDRNDNGVSDVQLLAIQSLVDTRGFKYEDLVTHVLGEVRDVNTLTHDEAVSVIQHGNHLYRENKQR